MRYREIVEAKPVKPLTPDRARKRAEKLAKAQAAMADTKTVNAIRLRKAKQRLSDI
jgi:hypothetical protein